MKRASSTYRLQLIKEVAIRRDRQCSNDLMANYIQSLIDNKGESDSSVKRNYRFSGSHFDEQVGGWVSDHWGSK
jgi:hypothetical protein